MKQIPQRLQVMKCVSWAVLLLIAGNARAQVAYPPVVQSTGSLMPASGVIASPTDVPKSVDFTQYLQLVRSNNLGIAAQKAQIDIADAQIALAALFPDPTFITGLAAYEMSKDKLPTIATFGLNFTIEGGKKRQVRTEAAQADKVRTQAEFERQIMAVQLDATNAFIDYLRARELQTYRQSGTVLLQRLLNRSQIVRKKTDAVAEVQLQTEVLRGQAELDAANADVYIFSRAMLGFVQPGAENADRTLESKGSLSLSPLSISDTTVSQVVREDVVVAQRALDVARKREELSRENRAMDLTFNVGVNHARPGEYLGTALPQSNSLMATVAIPIPFSLRQDGDLRAASAATTQALKQYQDINLRSALEAEQARARYRAAVSQMQKYQASVDLTNNALNSHLDLYLNNKSDLGDVVLLYKLVNESQTSSIEARANHARSMATMLNQVRELHTMKF
jgi:cobalt-zinc-cadmium efflux system outer membrane protein